MELNSGVALKKIAKKFFPRVNKSHPTPYITGNYALVCLCEKKMFEFFLIFSTEKNFLQNAVLSYNAAH